MSIETLKQDLKQIMASAPRPTFAEGDGSVTAERVAGFLANDLLPLIETLVDEVSEQDECIEAMVNQTEDILHEENAAVFSGIIVGAAALVAELRTRAGNDKRLLTMIREWQTLAAQGKTILEEITIADEDEGEGEGDEDQDEPEGEAAPTEAAHIPPANLLPDGAK